MFNRRLLLGLILLAIPASADLLQVSVSGQFGNTAPSTDVSAPNATWAITFDIDSQPTVDLAFLDDFSTGLSNLVYDLDGAAVSDLSTAEFFLADATRKGGLQLALSGDDDIEAAFNLQGAPLYSGATSNPQLSAGTYAASAASVVEITSTLYKISPGSFVITDVSPVPEPRANLLLATVLAGTAFLFRRRRRSAAPREESQG